MLLNPSNLLVLDEPTNHLDLDSKEVLLEALADYGGTLVFVSHDRYFVDKLATKVIDVGGGEAFVYPGGYEDFLYWKKQREAGVAAPLPAPARRGTEDAATLKPAAQPARTPATAPAAKPAAKAAPAAAAAAAAPKPDPLAPRLRPKSAPPERQVREREARKLKARLGEIEKQIGEKEQAIRDLEHLMASPGFYDDRTQSDKAATDHKALTSDVAELMSQWEALQTEFEALSQSAV
jgi:ATP-binding cassette subfamily F protein 3